MIKTFKEYLSESKKLYSFKVKIAGELPEDFTNTFKMRLDRCGLKTLEETAKTPIQQVPLDFPELKNMEVRVFDVVCEYPVTAPEIGKELQEMGMDPACFRVRGAGEPSEVEQLQAMTEPSGEALLSDMEYKEAGKIKHKDYFGDDFNKGFLKDLAKAAKERVKEEGKGEYKLPKAKQDKEGAKSAMGS
jgi:hypothetical protein